MKLVGFGDSVANLLSAFAEELANHGIVVPDAQYVAAGEVPWDGESLIMYLGAIVQGVPGRGISTSLVSPSQAISTSTLYVEMLRECSTFGYEGGLIGLPSDEVMQNEGVSALNDAGAMIKTAIILKSQGIPVELGVDYAIGACMPIGPMGGLSAMRLSLDISIDGSP